GPSPVDSTLMGPLAPFASALVTTTALSANAATRQSAKTLKRFIYSMLLYPLGLVDRSLDAAPSGPSPEDRAPLTPVLSVALVYPSQRHCKLTLAEITAAVKIIKRALRSRQ